MGLEIISELKKKYNYTTEELSQKSGVPVGTLNKILNGTTKDPKLETLKSLAKVLNCTLDDFDDNDSIVNISKIKEEKLISKFNSLNDIGKEEAIKRVSELAEIAKYTYEEPYTFAAHDDSLDEETAKNNMEKAKAIFKEMDKH